jgi:AraC family transcriptional regulator
MEAEPKEDEHDPRIRYAAGQEWLGPVDEAPPGFELFHLESGTYAVFTHRGPISRISDTVKYIWGTWAQKTDMVLREAPDFELYDERFAGNEPTSELDIYVPLR